MERVTSKRLANTKKPKLAPMATSSPMKLRSSARLKAKRTGVIDIPSDSTDMGSGVANDGELQCISKSLEMNAVSCQAPTDDALVPSNSIKNLKAIKTPRPTDDENVPCTSSIVLALMDMFKETSTDDEKVENVTSTKPLALMDTLKVQTPPKHCVSVSSIIELLFEVITTDDSPTRQKLPLASECKAVVPALIAYVKHVPPKLAITLFHGRGSTKKLRSWPLITELSHSGDLHKIARYADAVEAFEQKMFDLMEASLEYDPFTPAMCKVGCILAFWITKLYNLAGVKDEADGLPGKLILGRKQFLKQFGHGYATGCVCVPGSYFNSRFH